MEVICLYFSLTAKVRQGKHFNKVIGYMQSGIQAEAQANKSERIQREPGEARRIDGRPPPLSAAEGALSFRSYLTFSIGNQNVRVIRP